MAASVLQPYRPRPSLGTRRGRGGSTHNDLTIQHVPYEGASGGKCMLSLTHDPMIYAPNEYVVRGKVRIKSECIGYEYRLSGHGR